MFKAFLVICTLLLLQGYGYTRVYAFVKGNSILKSVVIYKCLEVLDILWAALGPDILYSYLWACCRSRSILLKGITFAGGILHLCLCFPFFSALSLTILSLFFFGGKHCLWLTHRNSPTVSHAGILYVQVVTLNVALNSKSSALTTLLIAVNFVELKSSVFKKLSKELYERMLREGPFARPPPPPCLVSFFYVAVIAPCLLSPFL